MTCPRCGHVNCTMLGRCHAYDVKDGVAKRCTCTYYSKHGRSRILKQKFARAER